MADDIEKELEVVKTKYKDVEGAELESCVPVMVRVKIIKTAHKNLIACFQFPEGYPNCPILMELKSKVFSDRLLDGLTNVCEAESKKLLGQRQIIPLLKFIRKFIDDNPLCVCHEEIAYIREKLIGEGDTFRLKQKTSQVVIKLTEGQFYISVRFIVPEEYPIKQIGVELAGQNFPDILKVNYLGWMDEIARRCVEPPLRKQKGSFIALPFEAKHSLRPVVEFLITDVIRKFPRAQCPCCGEQALPTDPKDVITKGGTPKFVERMYCGHLFHFGCLNHYMSIPPFTGGKKCPGCGNRIFHENWKVSPELAEARWAHKEARARELDEVVDFLL